MESGRRAAKAIDNQVEVLDQYQLVWFKGLSRIDDILYFLKMPQLIDTILSGLTLFLLWYFLVK